MGHYNVQELAVPQDIGDEIREVHALQWCTEPSRTDDISLMGMTVVKVEICKESSSQIMMTRLGHLYCCGSLRMHGTLCKLCSIKLIPLQLSYLTPANTHQPNCITWLQAFT